MSTQTPTPGPWYSSPVHEKYDGWTFCTVGPIDVRGKALEHHVEDTIAEVSGINHPCEANARLIAAAPDLLAALKDLRAMVIGEHGASAYENVNGERADAAIAKAEGR